MEKININTPLQPLPSRREVGTGEGERLISRVIPSEREMKKAVYSKDSSYDGIFFTAVKSTNIFCRPSCPARKPLEKNIVFYRTAHDALFAGFRPCRRCHPMEIGKEAPGWVEKLLR
jgi:AraC family transcriptional regulator, regulatory protein of adaptative response / methylated-DNA-[protein]-cysteine methyltransferase